MAFGRNKGQEQERDSALTDLKQRSLIREALDGAAREFGFAVKDIRSEVVDRAWFDRDGVDYYRAQDGLSDREKDASGPKYYDDLETQSRDPDREIGNDYDIDLERDEMER